MKRERDLGSDAVDDIFLDCVLDEDHTASSSSSSPLSIDDEEEEEEETEPTPSHTEEQSKKKELEHEGNNNDDDEKGGDMLFVPIQWTGFESRQRHSAMFNAPLLDAVQIDVWGAPCPLSVQHSLIQERKCGLFDPYLRPQDHQKKKRVKKTITIPISQQTLQDLFDSLLHTNQDWLIIWAYFGLLYGLCIESATLEQNKPNGTIGPVWIQTRHGFSILELTKLVQLCDFLQDHDTTQLLGQSLTQALSKQTHTTTSLIPVHLMEVLLSHSKELGLEKKASVFDMFYSTAIQSELKITTRFFVTALSSNFAISPERVRTMLRLLALREEQIYDSNSFGHYEPAQVDELAHCFIPLSQNVLNHLRNMYEIDTTRFEAEKLIHVTNRPITNMRLPLSSLTHSIHNISGFWNHAFKDLPLEIAHHLFLSGSMLVHELLSFYTHTTIDSDWIYLQKQT